MGAEIQNPGAGSLGHGGYPASAYFSADPAKNFVLAQPEIADVIDQLYEATCPDNAQAETGEPSEMPLSDLARVREHAEPASNLAFTLGMKLDPVHLAPGSRAAYSNHPDIRPEPFHRHARFLRGVHEPHPIASAEDSLLARPDISEALELVHLDLQREAEDPKNRIDRSLALAGLEQLVDVFSKGSLACRAVRRQTERLQGERAVREELQARANSRSSQTSSQSEKAARKTREAAHQAGARKALNEVAAAHPDIDFENVIPLIKKIRFPERNSVVMGIRAQKGFLKEVRSQAGKLIRDPQALLHTFRALHAINSASHDIEDIFFLQFAGDKVMGMLANELVRPTIAQEMSDPAEIASQWLQVVDGLPFDAGMRCRNSLGQIGEKVTVRFDPRDMKPDELMILLSQGTLSAILETSLQRSPAEFMDTLQFLTREGVASGDLIGPKCTAVNGAIGIALDQALMGYAFREARYAADNQQALDVYCTLRSAGFHNTLPSYLTLEGRTIRGAAMTEAVKKKIRQAFPRPQHLQPEQFDSRQEAMKALTTAQTSAIKRFEAWAQTPEGQHSTYAKFLTNHPELRQTDFRAGRA